MLDSRAEDDITRIKDYLSQNPSKHLILCGYSDASGNQTTNIPLSKSRAVEVADKLGNPNVKVFGFGSIHPQSDDANMNRRVECWVY